MYVHKGTYVGAICLKKSVQNFFAKNIHTYNCVLRKSKTHTHAYIYTYKNTYQKLFYFEFRYIKIKKN